MTAPFSHSIRVGWGDCDPAAIAFTGRLPWFALEAIEAWWEHHFDGDGWYQLNIDHNLGTPFVNMNIDFRSPVTPRHSLDCSVQPIKFGYSSVTFEVKGRQQRRICFEGQFTAVFVVADRFKKTSIPPHIKAVLEANLKP
ncbi:MAG: acyl-CoA thioesterase [Gammaproteobacteria bacterium]|nr:acyl-CoA thioesterase [Gammaproteobacteria bacterium]